MDGQMRRESPPTNGTNPKNGKRPSRDAVVPGPDGDRSTPRKPPMVMSFPRAIWPSRGPSLEPCIDDDVRNTCTVTFDAPALEYFEVSAGGLACSLEALEWALPEP